MLTETLEAHVDATWKLVVLECYQGCQRRTCEYVSLTERVDHYCIHAPSVNGGVRYKDPIDNDMIRYILRSYSKRKDVAEEIVHESRTIWPYKNWK